MSLAIKGFVTKVLVGKDLKSLVTTGEDEVQVTFEGFEGDRHAGLTMHSGGRTKFYPRGTEIRNLRQVSIVSEEELAMIAADMGLPELKPEWIGANLLVRGIPDLTSLPVMTRMIFTGGTVLMAGGENSPCTIAGDAIQTMVPDKPGLSQAFVKAGLHRRGITAWVELPGTIRQGDEVKNL